MHFKTLFWRAFITLLFILVILWLIVPEENVEQATVAENTVFKVSALLAEPATANIQVTSTGLTTARWPVDVTASVSGRVVQLATQSEPGDVVEEGFLLANLLDTAYQAEVKTAYANLKRAELNLAKYQHEQYVVKTINNGKKVSAFGRFEPHVAAANAEVSSMQAAVLTAQQHLADTKIHSPFNAVILDKYVTPSQWISAGEKLFSLASAEFVDVNVSLSQQKWQRLGKLSNQENILITTPEGEQWQANVRFLSPKMNETTRQRSLVLQVANPYANETPLLAGQQVSIQFSSRSVEHIVRAPSSVLTQDGKVWSIIDDRFVLESVEVIDEDGVNVLFRYKSEPELARTLVRYPLGTMLAGQRAIATFDE